MTLDLQLFYLLNNLTGQSPLLDGIIVFLASYLAYILVALFLVVVIVSHYSRLEKIEFLLVVGVSSLIARLGVTELIRFFYHRLRPLMDPSMNPAANSIPGLTETSWSFPSGHATFFFAMSTAIYLYNKKWGIVFFVATILMTLARVSAGVHYPSDILGGALIGMLVAYATFYMVRKLVQRDSPTA